MKQANLKSGSKISQIKILEQYKFPLVARLTVIDMLDLDLEKLARIPYHEIAKNVVRK